MVTQPDQLVATFFLPLAEPLALPSGSPIQTYLPMNQPAIDLLEMSGTDLALVPLHEPNLPTQLIPAGQSLGVREGKDQYWANKCTLSSSLLVHQVAANPWARSGIDAVAVVAGAASGGVYDSASTRLTTVQQSRRRPDMRPWLRFRKSQARGRSGNHTALLDEEFADARELGVGEITVIEAAIELRLLGDASAWLDDIEEPLSLVHKPAGPDGIAAYPDQWPFAFLNGQAEVAARLLERLYWALAVAIQDVRNVQKAYHMVTRDPITLVTQERLPHSLPTTLRRLRDVGNEDATYRLMTSVNENLWSLLRPAPLSKEQIGALPRARARVDGQVFSAHLDLHREADAALRRHGDSRVAVLLAAVAAESLLDELLLHMKWEEGQTPEGAAQGWIEGLTTRVKREYSRRLGGRWDLRSGPVAHWSDHVAAVRHRVVHAAYVPDVDEAQRALRTVNDLVSYACDRLATQERLTRYPRTALTLAGESGLARRGALTRRLTELQQSRDEPPWGETFARWRAAHNRVRQDLLGGHRSPSTQAAYLLVVRRVDGSLHACFHDRQASMAAPVAIDELNLPEAQRESLASILSRIAAEIPSSAVSVSIEQTADMDLKRAGPWCEEYHLVPLAGVMVEGNDFSAPTTHTIS